jgi:hypothetical protein
VARMGDRCACSFLMGNLTGKSPPGRPSRRWDDNIKIDILEVGWGGMDWTDLA